MLENNYQFTEEEKELNRIFFYDEIIRITELIDIILETSYIYNIQSSRFEFNYKRFERLKIEMNDKEKEILSSNKSLSTIVEEIHNDFFEEKFKNLNIGNFVDWAIGLMKKGFKDEKEIGKETLEIIFNLLPDVNKELYSKYSNVYKNVLLKTNETSIKKCKKKIQKKELEFKIHKLDDPDLLQKLNEDDENRKFYINSICKSLNVESDDVFDIIYEIYTLSEFDTVLAAVEGSQWIKDLPKKDPKHEARNTKGKLENAKKKLIDTLNELGMKSDATLIKEKINYKKTYYTKAKFEDEKKEQKEILLDSLINYCGTSKRRATIIIKILDFIN